MGVKTGGNSYLRQPARRPSSLRGLGTTHRPVPEVEVDQDLQWLASVGNSRPEDVLIPLQGQPSQRAAVHLQRLAGNQAVTGLMQQQRGLPVQRETGASDYRKLEAKKNAAFNDEAGAIADVSIGIKAKAKTRSRGGINELGHSWIEIALRQPWRTLDEATANGLRGEMGENTKRYLPVISFTSAGFYPAGGGIRKLIAVPGMIDEPEGRSMLARPSAKMTFPAAAPALGRLLKFIRKSKQDPPTYSFVAFNCSDWAVKAIRQIGKDASSFLGKVTSKGVTSPFKLYKRAHERAALGFGAAKVDTTLREGEQKLIEKKSEAKLKSVAGDYQLQSPGLSTEAKDVNTELEKSFFASFKDGVKAGRINPMLLASLPQEDLIRLEQIYGNRLDVMDLMNTLVDAGGSVPIRDNVTLSAEHITTIRDDLTNMGNLPIEIITALEGTDQAFKRGLVLLLRQPLTAIDHAIAEAARLARAEYPKVDDAGFRFSTGTVLSPHVAYEFFARNIDQSADQIRGALGDVQQDERERFAARVAEILGIGEAVVRQKLYDLGLLHAPPQAQEVAVGQAV